MVLVKVEKLDPTQFKNYLATEQSVQADSGHGAATGDEFHSSPPSGVFPEKQDDCKLKPEAVKIDMVRFVQHSTNTCMLQCFNDMESTVYKGMNKKYKEMRMLAMF